MGNDKRKSGDWLNLDILHSSDRKDFFNPYCKGQEDWPCYRLIITKAFSNLAQSIYIPGTLGMEGSIFDRHLENLKTYLKEFKKDNDFKDNPQELNQSKLLKIYYLGDFLELFPIVVENRRCETSGKYSRGLVLVDRSGGTFPLILYSGFKKDGKKVGDRLTAFYLASEFLWENRKTVHRIIMSNEFGKNWDKIREQMNESFKTKANAS